MKISVKVKESTTVKSHTSNRKAYYYFDISYNDVEIKEHCIHLFDEISALNNGLYQILYDEFCRSKANDQPRIFKNGECYELKFRTHINSIKDFINNTSNISQDFYMIHVSCRESLFDKEKHLLENIGFKFNGKDYPYADDCLCENKCTCEIIEDMYIDALFKNKENINLNQ